MEGFFSSVLYRFEPFTFSSSLGEYHRTLALLFNNVQRLPDLNLDLLPAQPRRHSHKQAANIPHLKSLSFDCLSCIHHVCRHQHHFETHVSSAFSWLI